MPVPEGSRSSTTISKLALPGEATNETRSLRRHCGVGPSPHRERRSGGGGHPDPAAGPERQTIEHESRSRIWEVVQTMNRPMREAIVLRYWAGHTYREMAEILDCPVATAQSRVRLAYQRLRTALAPDELINVEESR